MAFTLSVLISAALLTLVQAQNSTTNGIAPNQRLGWVSPPPGRSTPGIIWSCVSVLLLCSYKCIHLNIPSFEERYARWYEWPAISKYLRKLRWIVVILIAPELGVLYAVGQFLDARRSVKAAKGIAPQFEWSLAHGFYANMGGFGYFDATKITPLESKDLVAEIPDVTSQKLSPLTLKEYASLICKSTSIPIPFVTERSITDRSKSDDFTKCFAIVQCTWLIVGLIGRALAGLRSTQLELATAAYVFCAIIIYIFWWHKPFDINHVTILPYAGNDGFEFRSQFKYKWERIPLSDTGKDTTEDTWLDWDTIAALCTATLFSVTHLLAWNWEFPSPIGNLLWRVFGITATISPIAFLVGLMYEAWRDDTKPEWTGWAEWFVITIGIYVTARVGLIAIVIYSFTSMPAEVYQSVTWTEIWPHFS